jgi:hypothetical protein
MSKLTVPEFEALEEGPASKDAKEFNAQRTIAKLVVPLVFPPPKIRKRKNKAV